MDAPEAIFSIEFGKKCSPIEFMGDFIQSWALAMFTEDGFLKLWGSKQMQRVPSGL